MKFTFHTVNTDYCNYLRKSDPRVPYTMDKKSIRPFVGIVFTVNNHNYYAPLTSPKQKHISMKNQVDFLKINDGKWGAINFNNMIPVPSELLNKIELRHYENDSVEEQHYKNLLANQLSWCNSNKDKIIKQAEKLYIMITSNKAREALLNRCCNFKLDEENCLKYINQ
ncbi:MAG: type III toxin-antitoxin system ToxN/AbiQ family toxin [Clostridia bacterium]